MLLELVVRDLGVFSEADLVLEPGMTVLSGETGAGKTLLTDALLLALGGKADPGLVRPGAEQAVVEARFDDGGEEFVVRRVLPVDGRSRAYVDGSLANVATLVELGDRMVDLHGQHGHQTLLRPVAQRAAVDRFGRVDAAPMHELRRRVDRLRTQLAAVDDDDQARARELDICRFQADEIDSARIERPDEAAELEALEAVLADAGSHREQAALALGLAGDDGGAADLAAQAKAAIEGRAPFEDHAARLDAIVLELREVVADLRDAAESIEDDPERLAALGERRRVLSELQRKYGPTLTEVMEFRTSLARRIDELAGHDDKLADMRAELDEATAELGEVEVAVGAARRKAAPKLAKAVARRLPDLALGNARVEIRVGAEAGDEIEIDVAVNSGTGLAPLAKVASGGELSRMMLALELVLSAGAPTMVFDEVDAGVGGQAAADVGGALADLAADRQVFVVTHLPQVAAFADQQIVVHKRDDGRATTATAEAVTGDDRVIELSRMLSGSPDSAKAREHAAELLAGAARSKGSG